MNGQSDIIPNDQRSWEQAINRTLALLPPDSAPTVLVYESCTSTMDLAKSCLGRVKGSNEHENKIIAMSDRKEDASYAWIFSLSQSAGRGRSSRSWHSTASGGMYFSLVDIRGHSASSMSGLSLGIGLAIHNAFKDLGVQTALKWPNDVLMKLSPHRKISGILIESILAGDGAETLCHPIIGVGVNILQKEFPSDVPGTSLYLEKNGSDLNYVDLCMYFASAIHKSYLSFLNTGFLYIKEEWWNSCLLKSANVETESPPLKGIVAGISDSGALLIDVKDEVSGNTKTVEIHAGDVRCTYDFMY